MIKTRLSLLILFFVTLFLVACNGGGSTGNGLSSIGSISQNAATNLGVLSDGAIIQSSSGNFNLTGSESTTGTIGIIEGNSGDAGIITFSVSNSDPLSQLNGNQSLPTITTNPGTCVVTDGNNICQFQIYMPADAADGTYLLTPTYTHANGIAEILSNILIVKTGNSVNQMAAASVSGTKPSINVVTTKGSLSVSVAKSSIATSGTTTATITLTGSSNITSLPVSVATSNGNVLKLSTSTCNLKTTANNCTITLTGNSVGSATISAAASGYTTAKSNAISVSTPVIPGTISVSLTSANITSGNSTIATIKLNNSTGVTGLTATATSGNTGIASLTPASCTLSTANNSCQVTVKAGSTTGTTTITSSATGYTAAQTSLVVSAKPVPGTLSIALSSPTVIASESTIATITLSGSVNESVVIATVSSGNTGFATVSPGSCTLSTAANTCKVSVKGINAGTTSITASSSGYTSAQTSVTVSPYIIAGYLSLVLKSSNLAYGESTIATVNLVGSSGVTKFSESITSGNISIATVTPGSCFESSGSPSCTVIVTAGSQSGSTAISVVASGYNTVPVSLNVRPMPIPGTLSVNFNNPYLAYGESTTATITLNGSQYESNVPVTIIAGNGATVIPATCTLSTANNTCSVTIIAGSQSTATGISLNSNGYTTTLSTINIVAPSSFMMVGEYGQINSLSNNTLTNLNIPLPQINGVTYNGSIFIAVGGKGTIITSPDAVNWTPQHSNTASNLWGITYGGGQLVAVGDNGTILTSPDGITWNLQTSPSSSLLHGVVYGNGQYVAVGVSGTILNSSDGKNWTASYSNVSINLFAITYGNGKFVTVGGLVYGSNNGVIFTSSNGVSWTSQANLDPYGRTLLGVTYHNGIFIAVGQSLLTGETLLSSDGVTWIVESNPSSGQIYYGITYAESQFIAVGIPGPGGNIINSTNGVTWLQLAPNIKQTNFTCIAYGGGKIVAAGYAGIPSVGVIMSSSDGINWNPQTSMVQHQNLYAITHESGLFVAVGGDSFNEIGTILTSHDGVSWTSQLNPDPIGEGDYLSSIVYGGGLYVAGSNEGTIITSPDAINWTSQNNPSFGNSINGLAYGESVFVAVGGEDVGGGNSSIIITSTNGTIWSTQSIPQGGGYELWSVIYANNKFVAVGGDSENSSFNLLAPQSTGNIISSTDGINWTAQNDPDPNQQVLFGITYGEGKFVAVGGNPFLVGGLNNSISTILTSPDGINWTVQANPGIPLTSVSYGGGEFVAAGLYGKIITSPDGINWTQQLPFMNGITVSGIIAY